MHISRAYKYDHFVFAEKNNPLLLNTVAYDAISKNWRKNSLSHGNRAELR